MSNKHAGVTSATIGGEKFAFKATLKSEEQTSEIQSHR